MWSSAEKSSQKRKEKALDSEKLAITEELKVHQSCSSEALAGSDSILNFTGDSLLPSKDSTNASSSSSKEPSYFYGCPSSTPISTEYVPKKKSRSLYGDSTENIKDDWYRQSLSNLMDSGFSVSKSGCRGGSALNHSVPLIIDTGLIGSQYPLQPVLVKDEGSPPVRDSGGISPSQKYTPGKTADGRAQTQSFSLFNYIQPLNLRDAVVPVSAEELCQEENGEDGIEIPSDVHRAVRLEEKLTVICSETDYLRREKSELACQLAALRAQLKFAGDTKNEDFVLQLERELRAAQEAREHIEGNLSQTRTALESKMLECHDLGSGLQMCRQSEEQLYGSIKELEDSVEGKDATIRSLKTKIAELYTQVDLTRISKEQVEQDMRKLKVEINSLLRNRDWYQEQLKSTQEARNKLQLEINRLHGLLCDGSNVSEGLNHENNMLKMKLSKLEQNIVQEKKALSLELENVKADIIEREALFEQLMEERNALEEALTLKAKQLHEEKLRVQFFQTEMKELEQEIVSLNSQLATGKSQLEAAEIEKTDLTKRVSYIQECLNQKESVIEEQCEKYNEIADKLRKLDDSCHEKDSLIQTLSEEKATLEVTLTSSKKEKDALDKYLSSLKGDMVKVEDSFKKLRQELTSTSNELNHVTSLRDDLQCELTSRKEEIEVKSCLIDTLNAERENADKSFQSLQEENCNLRNDIGNLRQELESAEMKIAQLEESYSTLSKDRDNTARELNEAQTDMLVVKNTMREMRNNLEMLNVEHGKYMDLLAAHEAMTLKYHSLEQEHTKLEQLYKTETEQLRVELVAKEDEKAEIVRKRDEEIRFISSELDTLNSSKSDLENKVTALELQHMEEMQKASEDFSERMKELSVEISELQQDKEACDQSIAELQVEMESLTKEYNDKLDNCQSAIAHLEGEVSHSREIESQSRDLSLELERAKGTIAGLMETVNQLKQHGSLLEDALAKREASFVKLAKKSDEKIKLITQEKAGLLNRLSLLEKRSQEDEDVRKELIEKISYYQHQCQLAKVDLENLRKENDQLKTEYKKKMTENNSLKESVRNLQNDMETKSATVERLTKEKSDLSAEKRQTEEKIDLMNRKENELVAELDVVRQDVKNKTSEIGDLKNRLDALSGQHTKEMQEMKDLLKASGDEASNLENELARAREEKLSSQSKLARLRGALKAMVHRYRLFTKDEEGGSEPNPMALDVNQMEKLLEDSMPLTEPKPVRGVTRCLENLHSEMAGLQQQVAEHTSTVNSSFNSWQRLEWQAADLRRACATTGPETEH